MMGRMALFYSVTVMQRASRRAQGDDGVKHLIGRRIPERAGLQPLDGHARHEAEIQQPAPAQSAEKQPRDPRALAGAELIQRP